MFWSVPRGDRSRTDGELGPTQCDVTGRGDTGPEQMESIGDQLSCGERSPTLHLFWTCVSSRDTPQLSWSPTLHLSWTCVSCRDTTQLRWSPTLHLFSTCVSSRDTPQLCWSQLSICCLCLLQRHTTTKLVPNSPPGSPLGTDQNI